MKILGIDTTGLTASVAVIDEEKTLVELTLNHKLTHSETLMPMIVEALEKIETDIKDIDYIACSNGPGSFTGLRIGVATAKGLGFALNKKIISVPTLEALAYNVFESNKIICPIMDARRNEVYSCFYIFKDSNLQCLNDIMAEDINEIIRLALEYKEKLGKDVIFIGDGVSVHRDIIIENNFLVSAPNCSLQRGSSVASLGLSMIKSNKEIEFNLNPIYVRKPQAERELLEKIAKEESK